jgi:hypothetical protein
MSARPDAAAAVHPQRLASDEAGVLGEQEGDGRRELVRLAKPADRDAGQIAGLAGRPVWVVLPEQRSQWVRGRRS